MRKREEFCDNLFSSDQVDCVIRNCKKLKKIQLPAGWRFAGGKQTRFLRLLEAPNVDLEEIIVDFVCTPKPRPLTNRTLNPKLTFILNHS